MSHGTKEKHGHEEHAHPAPKHHGEEEEQESPATPKYEGKSTEELWGEYHSLHEISEDGKVNKPQTRERKVKKHKKSLDEMVNDALGISDEEVNLKGNANAKKKAIEAIKRIVHEGYKAKYGKDDVEAPNEELIRTFLSEVYGGQVSYDDLIKEMMNADDLSADKRQEHSPYFHRLVEYVARSKDDEGRAIQHLMRELSKHEHWNKLRGLVGEATGHEYDESATPHDLFSDYHTHVQTKQMEIVAKQEKTYRKRKPAHEKEAA